MICILFNECGNMVSSMNFKKLDDDKLTVGLVLSRLFKFFSVQFIYWNNVCFLNDFLKI